MELKIFTEVHLNSAVSGRLRLHLTVCEKVMKSWSLALYFKKWLQCVLCQQTLIQSLIWKQRKAKNYWIFYLQLSRIKERQFTENKNKTYSGINKWTVFFFICKMQLKGTELCLKLLPQCVSEVNVIASVRVF